MIKSEATTWTFNGLPGHVESRNGKASSRYSRWGKKFRRTHPVGMVPKNRRIVENLHREFVEDVLSGRYEERQQKAVKRDRKASEARDEFLKLRAGKDSVNVIGQHNRAFAYYIGSDDFALSYDALYQRLEDRESEERQLATDTKRKYLQSMRTWARWLTGRGYISMLTESGEQRPNPVDVIGIPPKGDHAPTEVLTPKQVGEVIKWHRERAYTATHRRHARERLAMAIFIEIAYQTGARPSEIIRARLEDIDDDAWAIWGKSAPKKGQRTDSNKKYRDPRQCRDMYARIRYIPLRSKSDQGPIADWQRRIRELLDEAKKLGEFDGWLLPYAYTQKPNDGLKAALKALGLADKNFTFKDLRKAARWRMENELGIDPFTIGDLFGHSVEVSVQSYRKKVGKEDIIQTISRYGPGDSNPGSGSDSGAVTTS